LRHEIAMEGYAYRLRPVAADDAAFIAKLRGDPTLTRYLHRGDGDIDAQRKWLDVYFRREGDWYFVIERSATGVPEGLAGIYDFEPEAARAEWGRWILQAGSQAAVASVLLVYRIAFGPLRLNEIYCRTLADNVQVVSFHDRCGLTRSGTISGHVEIDGVRHDAIEHRLSRDGWPEVEARLVRLAEPLARRLERTITDEARHA
jgi:RimJ/RimL family protein N-acetyltransferase